MNDCPHLNSEFIRRVVRTQGTSRLRIALVERCLACGVEGAVPEAECPSVERAAPAPPVLRIVR